MFFLPRADLSGANAFFNKFTFCLSKRYGIIYFVRLSIESIDLPLHYKSDLTRAIFAAIERGWVVNVIDY